MNARMYAVTPEVEAPGAALLGHVADEAGVALDYLPYPAPQPLEHLWTRPDLGCVFMCGYPIALGAGDGDPARRPDPATPPGRQAARCIAPTSSCARTRPTARWRTRSAGAAGWTVEHSHSGFNAFRHHLLRLPHARAADALRAR